MIKKQQLYHQEEILRFLADGEKHEASTIGKVITSGTYHGDWARPKLNSLIKRGWVQVTDGRTPRYSITLVGKKYIEMAAEQKTAFTESVGALDQLSKTIHASALAKGWWHNDDEKALRAAASIALIHSELSEALEAVRVNLWDSTPKSHGVGEEIADTIIRILDFCGYFGINIAQAVKDKMQYNSLRSHRHGDKRL